MHDDPRKVLRRLYRDFDDGYDDLSSADEKAISRSRSSSIYGEIMPAATMHLLEYLQLRQRDVIYDLGSGVGKFVIQTGLTVPVRKAAGIELARSRCKIAAAVREIALQQKLFKAKCVEFLCQDLLKTDLSDATVIYCCSTAFPPSFMKRLVGHLATLRKGLTFVSLQKLDDNTYFEQVDVLHLDMSWKRNAKVPVYRLVNPRVA